MSEQEAFDFTPGTAKMPPPRSFPVVDRPRPKRPSSSDRVPSSLATLFVPPAKAPPPPPTLPRQQSLPALVPVSPSKRSPLGSITPQSSGGDVQFNEDTQAPLAKTRGRSFSNGLKGALEAVGKRASTTSLKKELSLMRRSRDMSTAQLENEQAQAQTRPPTPAPVDVLPAADDWLLSGSTAFADSLEHAFDQVAGSHAPGSGSPPVARLVVASQGPLHSSSVVAPSTRTDIHHSCQPALHSTTGSISTIGPSIVAGHSPHRELPCCTAHRAVLPYHLQPTRVSPRTQQQLDDEERRAAFHSALLAMGIDPAECGTPIHRDAPNFNVQADDALVAYLGKIRHGDLHEENEHYVDLDGTLQKGGAQPSTSPTSSGGSAGPSPPFAIGSVPMSAGEKLVRRGTVRKSVFDGWVGSEAGSAVKDGGNPGRDRTPDSPSSPTAPYSHKSGSRLGLFASKYGANHPNESISSPDWIKSETAHPPSLNSSLSSVWSQASAATRRAPTFVEDYHESDGDVTEREHSLTPNVSPSVSNATLPYRLPAGLRYITSPSPSSSSAGEPDKHDGLPLSPPPSADLLADVGSSPFGSFPYDRGGPDSPADVSKMGWFFRRGEPPSSPLARFEDVASEANTSGGYHPDEEEANSSFDSFGRDWQDEVHDVQLEPVNAFSGMMRGLSLFSTANLALGNEQPSDEDAQTPTGPSFVRSPGAPSPSPNLFSSNPDALSSPLSPTVHALETGSLRPRRPLPQIPQSNEISAAAALTRTPRPQSQTGAARPRSMYEPVPRPPVTSLPPGVDPAEIGTSNPHALSPIAGSPATATATHLAPAGSAPARRGAASPSPLGRGTPSSSPLVNVAFGAQRGRGPSALGEIRIKPVGVEEQREKMEEVRTELEVVMGYKKVVGEREEAQSRVEADVGVERQRSLRRTVKRRSLVEEVGERLTWPAIEGEVVEGEKLDEMGARRLSTASTSSSVVGRSAMDAGASGAAAGLYLRRIESESEAPPSSPIDSIRLKARASATSLRALFSDNQRRPALPDFSAAAPSEDPTSTLTKSRSNSFSSRLFGRRTPSDFA